MTTPLLIIALTAAYLLVVVPLLLRLVGANARLRGQREADLERELRNHGQRGRAPSPSVLDAYETTDRFATSTDMEQLQ